MGIRFDNSVLYTNQHPQTVEESFRVYGNYAAIHDFNFDSHLEQASLTLTRVTPSSWVNRTILETIVPSDCLLEFDIPSSQDVQNGFAALMGWSDAEDAGYAIGFSGSNVFFALYSGNTITKLAEIPTPFEVHYGHFKIAFRQQFYSSEATDLWVSMSIWCNDALIDTYSFFKQYVMGYAPQVGFAFYGASASFDVQNIRIPQLTAFVEWNSIDPEEAPMNALQRAIEGRYLKFFFRYNGALRAWRNTESVETREFLFGEGYSQSERYDPRNLFSHVRILGAYVEAEYVAASLLGKGHRFMSFNNPFLMTVADCYKEAKNQVRRMREEAITANISSAFTPLLEIEDRIQTPFGPRIINTLSWKFTSGTVDQELEARLYGFEA